MPMPLVDKGACHFVFAFCAAAAARVVMMLALLCCSFLMMWTVRYTTLALPYLKSRGDGRLMGGR